MVAKLVKTSRCEGYLIFALGVEIVLTAGAVVIGSVAVLGTGRTICLVVYQIGVIGLILVHIQLQL